MGFSPARHIFADGVLGSGKLPRGSWSEVGGQVTRGGRDFGVFVHLLRRKSAEIACLGRAARPEASARPKHPSSDFGITSSFQAALVALF